MSDSTETPGIEQARAILADMAAAAGELRVPIPTPGTDAARLLLANVAMRRERDDARADLAGLRLEHEAHAILLDCARRDRDEARAQAYRLGVEHAADVARGDIERAAAILALLEPKP